MITAAGFVLAGAAGSLARWTVAVRANHPGRLPWGTLAVNVTGSFLLALATAWDAPALTVVGTGGLGAYTTFSTFAAQLVDAGERRRWDLAGADLGLSVVGGVAAALAGLELVA